MPDPAPVTIATLLGELISEPAFVSRRAVDRSAYLIPFVRHGVPLRFVDWMLHVEANLLRQGQAYYLSVSLGLPETPLMRTGLLPDGRIRKTCSQP